MNHLVLSLADPRTPLTALRCRSYAGFLNRLAAIEGHVSTVVDGSLDAPAALAELAAAAGLTAQGEPPGAGEIRYVPTPAARDRVGAERDGVWPQSLASRQRKALRRTPGVLIAFPLEEPTTTDSVLEVFTTDWSPSPAACAVAVHPGHALSSGLPTGCTSAFTGRYCRHPLTGDLLPIWTAVWVRPEFGTGAVLVNPGHDAADLAFGREIGLPVRFALAPDGHDDSPRNWPTPPVVKAGRAIRTGVTDGLEFTAAQEEYLRILKARDLAREYTDFGAGSFTVAVFAAEGPDEIRWDRERRTVVTATREAAGVPARMTPTPILAAADPAARRAQLSVVAPSSAVESELLALRLLLAEPDLGPMPGSAPDVVLVGTVTGQPDAVDQDILALAVLTAAAAQETLSTKPQQLDSARRFLSAHAALAESTEVPVGDADTATMKAAGQIKALVQQRDTKQAFTHLYRLQKSLTKGEKPLSGALAVYEALAWVVAGLPSRYPHERLSSDWQLI